MRFDVNKFALSGGLTASFLFFSTHVALWIMNLIGFMPTCSLMVYWVSFQTQPRFIPFYEPRGVDVYGALPVLGIILIATLLIFFVVAFSFWLFAWIYNKLIKG